MSRPRGHDIIGQVRLPDGQALDYVIRSSARTRSLRLRLSPGGGLTVSAPRGLAPDLIARLVTGRAEWIARQLEKFGDGQHRVAMGAPALPGAFELPALGQHWRVEYRITRGSGVSARTHESGLILVAGRSEDAGARRMALLRWLARHARATLEPWLADVAGRTGLRHAGLTIKNQRSRWGSCSSQGWINLNCKLLFLPPELVRYVFVHELCHTLEHNHSPRYWAHVRRYEPEADRLHGRMRDAWKAVPPWVGWRSPADP